MAGKLQQGLKMGVYGKCHKEKKTSFFKSLNVESHLTNSRFVGLYTINIYVHICPKGCFFFFPFLYHCKNIVKDVFIFVVVQSWVSYSTIFYTSTPVRLLMKGLCYLLSTELLGFKNVHIYSAQWPFSLLGLAFFSLVSFSYEGQLLE